MIVIQISMVPNSPCIKVQQSPAQVYTIIIRVNPSIPHYSNVDLDLKITQYAVIR